MCLDAGDVSNKSNPSATRSEQLLKHAHTPRAHTQLHTHTRAHTTAAAVATCRCVVCRARAEFDAALQKSQLEFNTVSGLLENEIKDAQGQKRWVPIRNDELQSGYSLTPRGVVRSQVQRASEKVRSSRS